MTLNADVSSRGMEGGNTPPFIQDSVHKSLALALFLDLLDVESDSILVLWSAELTMVVRQVEEA